MKFLGLLARAAVLAAGAVAGVAIGAAIGAVLAMKMAATPADVACAAEGSCAPGLGMAGFLGGFVGAFLGGITGFVAAGVVLMRRALREPGAAENRPLSTRSGVR